MGISRHFSDTAASACAPGTNPERLEASFQGTLIDPRFDCDSCGVGFVAQLSAQPSYQILLHALTALGRLEHRGAVAADGKSSDGVGVTTRIPREWLLAQAGVKLSTRLPLGVAAV